MCGAVNTIVNDDDVLTGHITDGIGYMRSLRDNGIDVIRKKITVVGCRTMNGRGMMLFQGAASFKLWTGQDMPIEHMKEVLGIHYDI